MIYSDGGETGFVERMVIESIEEGIRGRCRSVSFFFSSPYSHLCEGGTPQWSEK